MIRMLSPRALLPFVSALGASLLLAVPQLHAATWEIDTAHSSAQFTVRHLMISNVRGEFSKLSGTVEYDPRNPKATQINATIDATTINTREPKRDEHLRSADFFDVARFPTITFRSKSVEPQGKGKLKVRGELTIHGVTREVTLDVTGPTQEIRDPWGNVKLGASATTRINRRDFGLLWNKALESGGVVVGDEVDITLDVELLRKAEGQAAQQKTK